MRVQLISDVCRKANSKLNETRYFSGSFYRLYDLGIKKEKAAVIFSAAPVLSAVVDACRKKGVY